MILGFRQSKHNSRNAPKMGMVTRNTPTASTYASTTMLPPTAQNSRKAMKQIINNSALVGSTASYQNTTNSNNIKPAWGAPTWFLLHTLAEKVSIDTFDQVRVGLLNMMYSICINLPCPTCATHAKDYLDKTNFNRLQTKDQLKQMLFEFHNTVNGRKGYPMFAMEELGSKYERAILINVVNNFIAVFSSKTKNIRLLADDLKRSMITSTLKDWFQANRQFFTE